MQDALLEQLRREEAELSDVTTAYFLRRRG
jgi:hypothetical protein